MSKLTIKEIARMAGVSQTAVSFVLNNKQGVSDETRRKVNEIIERTNFKPSLSSRRLFFKKSGNVTLVIKQTSSPFNNLFYFEIAKGLLEKSKEFGYNIVFSDLSFDGDNIVLPDIIKFNDTDGIIFLEDIQRAVLNEIEKLEIPYVVIDAHTVKKDTISVNADYELSSYTATRYLAENGHKDVAYIGSSYIPEFYLQCFTGYKKALDEKQLSIPSSWLQIDASDETSSYCCMERILRNTPVPSAVFCTGDIFAIGAMKCVKDHGYKVPEDISFIAIDDILLSSYVEPKLTTIKIDKEKMGRLAMELIMKKIGGETVQSIMVESDNIIVRDTVSRRQT